MTHWEADVYAKNLPPDQWNARWWKYVRDFQGVEPPSARGEEFCDAATKTHINDKPCYYYSYAIATVLKFQLHDYIARKILHQPPQACNYADNNEVGAFLRKSWRKAARRTGAKCCTMRPAKIYPLAPWSNISSRCKPGWKSRTKADRSAGSERGAFGDRSLIRRRAKRRGKGAKTQRNRLKRRSAEAVCHPENSRDWQTEVKPRRFSLGRFVTKAQRSAHRNAARWAGTRPVPKRPGGGSVVVAVIIAFVRIIIDVAIDVVVVINVRVRRNRGDGSR